MSCHQQLFALINEKMPTHLSLVHEVSETLNISYDSAYRRIRGAKPMSMDEVSRLCQRFDISLDALFGTNGHHHLLFQVFPVEPELFSVDKWLDNILTTITHLHDGRDKQIVYAAKDPPVFSYLQFPVIAAFKFFFWSKTLFHIKEFEEKKFNLSLLDNGFEAKCQRISDLAMKVPTTEIWNEDTFRIFMRQIEYHWISGYFESRAELELLLAQIEHWLCHNQKQAELGFRYRCGDNPVGIENSYKLYENEVVLNDNTIYTMRDGVQTVFLTYNVLGLLASNNPDYCNSIASFHKVLMSKSNLISQTGEKERNRFYNKLHQIIEQFRSQYL